MKETKGLILSFAWTTGALMEGLKTESRRVWSDRQLDMWWRAWAEGRRRHQAWDKVPRAGGKRVTWIWLTAEPRRERLGDITPEAVEREGGLWAGPAEFIEAFGKSADTMVAVIRFEPLCRIDGQAPMVPGSGGLCRFHGGHAVAEARRWLYRDPLPGLRV